MNNDFIITEIARVITVGKQEYTRESHSFNPNLKYNELIFYFSGQSTVYFGNTTLAITPFCVELLPQGKTARYDVTIHEPIECIDVFFSTDRPISDQALVWEGKPNERLASLFQQLFARWVGKDAGYYFECASLLYKILAQLQKQGYSPTEHQKKIEPALRAIHTSFLQEDLTVGKLAALCDMSESYLKRLFKERYGIPPKKYLIQLKLNHACDLLRLDRYTVTEIAEMCHFSDIYFFSRQFKEHMGITPTQFVKKYKSAK